MTHSSTCGYSPRPPVSVSGTGTACLKLSGFSREPPSPRCPVVRRRPVLSRLGTERISPPRIPSRFNPQFRLRAAVPVLRPRFAARAGTGMLTRSPSDWPPSQRRALRPRLTLIRLALIRKPWSSGVRVSHPHCRYSCLHLPFRTLQHASRHTFKASGMLPYRYCYPTSSAARFMPVHYPYPPARLVSCYALFEWMAASKPTSQLSLQADLVSPT